jgi:hypothetical protein
MDENMKEALAEYLRDNLTIELDTDMGYYGEVDVVAILKLDGKEFSRSYGVSIKKGSY